MTSQKRKLEVHGVHIPYPGEEYNCWITPFWYDVMEFYPAYCDLAKEKGIEPYRPQPYMLTIAKEICKVGANRPEYTEERVLERAFEHFGLLFFEKYMR
jgi:hypothetical protein